MPAERRYTTPLHINANDMDLLLANHIILTQAKLVAERYQLPVELSSFSLHLGALSVAFSSSF